ncbi:MAG: nucleotide exchange factor GrpE [Ignavibacteria bacterium]|nr:nucleotide exchange factor GrpE [Ignavibacteria bacterium]
MKKKKETMEELNNTELENQTNANKEDESKIEVEISSSQENSSNEELNLSQQKISELEAQVKHLQDLLLRKAAEFENYKRRTENDQVNLLKYAAEPFIKSVLIVYDDLERSLNHINDDYSFESLKKGLELVYEKFTKILESQGIKKIDAKGKQFDVEFHEALMQQPVAGLESNIVLDVIEQGYMYKDKVIRHAKVIVSAPLNNEENKIEE